jgi:hypothetical protein
LVCDRSSSTPMAVSTVARIRPRPARRLRFFRTAWRSPHPPKSPAPSVHPPLQQPDGAACSRHRPGRRSLKLGVAGQSSRRTLYVDVLARGAVWEPAWVLRGAWLSSLQFPP